MVKDTYTTDEAAAMLEVTPGRVRQMVRAGVLRAEKFGRAHFIPAEALRSAAERKRKPGPTPKAKPEDSPASATNGTAKRTEVTAAKKRAAQKTTT